MRRSTGLTQRAGLPARTQPPSCTNGARTLATKCCAPEHVRGNLKVRQH